MVYNRTGELKLAHSLSETALPTLPPPPTSTSHPLLLLQGSKNKQEPTLGVTFLPRYLPHRGVRSERDDYITKFTIAAFSSFFFLIPKLQVQFLLTLICDNTLPFCVRSLSGLELALESTFVPCPSADPSLHSLLFFRSRGLAGFTGAFLSAVF